MRNRVGWYLIAGLLWALPATVHAQFEEVPPSFTAFLSHPRYESGGFYVGMDFLYMRTGQVVGTQTVARRGFIDADGSIGGLPGIFYGSGQEALNTNQLHGPGSYTPGFDLSFGWRFEDGVTVELSWWHLVDYRQHASANLVPEGFLVGKGLANTYLTAPVYNFPIQYGGTQNLLVGSPGATYGIWNAATVMDIDFVQRFEKVDLSLRIPMLQTESYRNWGTVGSRALILWDRFKWRTVDADANGSAVNSTEAYYTNIVSNRLYGVFVGCGNEWFLGSTPIGGFSFSLDVEGSLALDMVKTRARWELGDRSTAATRARNSYTFAPGVLGKIGFWWYPWEAITVHIGWDAMAVFNTVASRNPIDFNFASLDPEYNRTFMRLWHGLQLGVGFVF